MDTTQQKIAKFLEKNGYSKEVAEKAALADTQKELGWFYRCGLAFAAAKRISGTGL